MTKFTDLSLDPAIQKALDKLGFTEPTQIQSEAIPLLLQGKGEDFHGQAQTGTGKTLAFGIPLVQRVDATKRHTQSLVVAPTRELVLQIVESLQSINQFKKVSIDAIYGGVPIVRQIKALKSGVQIVVGTPGRLNDLLRRKVLKLDRLDTLVLDEADIMLDMGFKEEIDEILKYAPENRNIWLFSATVKSGINQIKDRHMRNPKVVRISPKDVTAKNTKQYYCVLSRRHRLAALCRFVDCAQDFYGIIFTPTKALAADISHALSKQGYPVGALHGDMNQLMRNKVIQKFKHKEITILVATDVAARGIDVNNLTHVINYSLPEDQESYVHRIGRTGRAGNEGVAITFVARQELNALKRLATRFKADIEKRDVPSVDEVMAIKVNKALECVKQPIAHKQVSGKALDKIRASLLDCSKDELVENMVNVLANMFLSGFDKHEDIPKDSGDYKQYDGRNTNPDQQELMLNVGTMDGISRRDVLRLITGCNKINHNDIERLRVIKKRSFVTVHAKRAEGLIRALRGKTLGGRKLHVRMSQ